MKSASWKQILGITAEELKKYCFPKVLFETEKKV